MAKDVKKTQKKSVIKEDNKKQPKNEVVKKKKVVVEEVNIDTKKTTKKGKEELTSKVVEKANKETSKNNNKDEVKKEKKSNKNEDRLISTMKTIDDNRKAILFGIVGFLVATLLFRCILWPDRIATLKDGTQPIVTVKGKTITADDLYTSMKKNYSVNILLNDIDKMILNEMYPETEDMISRVNSTAEYYYSIYEQSYGYTKETFLSKYGFASENDFIESLKLDYRRDKYFNDYAKKLVTEKEIDKYYKDDVYGDVDSKHILVKVDKEGKDGLSDEDAKKLANEIITKLNNSKEKDINKAWDEVIKEYGDKIVHEELGYNAFNASLESSYLEECKKLEVGKYSKTPVLTSYGYHIVYKVDQKKKPSLEEVKDDIITILANEKKDADKNMFDKSLIKMREDAKLEFTDTKLGDEYKEYTNTYK